ncbi:MAG: hypothetical protein C4306_05035 [Thermoleophilia bacterium]
MRQRARDGGGFEEAAAYSRAIRHGSIVAVSGTTCSPDDAVPPDDSYLQAKAAIRRALAAAERLGATRHDVIRTRLLLAPGCDWEAVARAHREEFEHVQPANTTFYVGGLVPAGVLVEVELDAVVEEPPR